MSHLKTKLSLNYGDIISLENILAAWKEFLPGKKEKKGVQLFSRDLMHHSIQLHNDLVNQAYQHGGYESFHISDPKPRHIHKASVRDRLLHHAIYRKLYPFLDKTFIADSYSCRKGKGTHKAIDRFTELSRIVSKNNTSTCWVLQCDIEKFFASIDQQVLLGVLQRYIPDRRILWLLQNVIQSFSLTPGKGLPLGNLTSQLFVNVYMNAFDQFVKHMLKAKYYIRYADDFVMLSKDREWLESLIPAIREYLHKELKLSLHPHKVSIRTYASGIDFLGWIHFPYHRILRTTTKRRMMRRIEGCSREETFQSYLGLLQHGATHRLSQEIWNAYYLSASSDSDFK